MTSGTPEKSYSSVMADKNKKAVEFIEDVTTNAEQVQKKVLTEILTRNSGVEYLQHHGLGGQIDKHSFKKIIPVITYEDIQPHINRIANGDNSSILCSQPISEFLASSGTSGGESKLIPTTEEDTERRWFSRSLWRPIMNQYTPGLDKGKAMYFLFVKSEFKTPGGLFARTAITSLCRSSHFINRANENDPNRNYTAPNETILCPDYYQSMYSQMLCGLCHHKEVVQVGATFASGLIRAIQFLENHWLLLCNDIRTGTLNPEVTDKTVRESILKILKPDADLADYVEVECSKKSWKGIIAKLWPKTKYVEAILTGVMSQYIPTLEYYSDGLPLVSSYYSSSECYFGLNLNPLCKPREVSYTLIPTMAYFEFLPVQRNNVVDVTDFVREPKSLTNDEKEQRKLVDLVDVKLGEEYEIVVTTYTGLYRYRVGDLLRVSGFKNKAPQFNFICRKNIALSIDGDKTDEAELQNAVENAVIKHLRPVDASLVDYTAYADTSTAPGHYVIFWEYTMHNNGSTTTTTTQVVHPSVFEDCCVAIEDSLNSMYRYYRAIEKSIGPLEMKIVERGTFNELMDYAISLGSSMSQYKTPRSVKSASVVELLNSKVVSNHFSPKCPTWVSFLGLCSRRQITN